MQPRTKGYALLAEQLCEASGNIFALPGDANLALAAELSQDVLVSAIHEADAVAMAMAYSISSGRLGVATVTRGPGLTNGLTALTEAVRSHVPLVLVVGDTAADAPEHPQAIDHRAFAAASGAEMIDVRAPGRLEEAGRTAIRRALVGSRPVVLNVPVDVQYADVDMAPAGSRKQSQLSEANRTHAIGPNEEDLDRALGIIASAARPIVLAGRGAVEANAARELLELARRLGAPVATSLRGRGLFAGDVADVGIAGSLSSSVAIDVFRRADVVITFGASLNRYTTDNGGLLSAAAVVQCDVDPEALNSRYPADACVLGDASATARAIRAALELADVPASTFRDTVTDELLAYDPSALFTDKGTAAAADPRTITHALPAVLPPSYSLAVDAGRFMPYVLTHLPVTGPRRLVTTLGFAPIGLGVPAAIGMAYGRHGKTAVAVVGDGGFMLGGLGAFNAAARLGVDLIVVVYNDGSYGAEATKLQRRGEETALVEFSWPDFAAVAETLGGTGIRVSSVDDLNAARATIDDRTGPVLLDCRIDQQAASELPL